MPPMLAFIHIPKTAGTSFRVFMWQSFGRENVFWHDPTKTHLFEAPKDEVAQMRALGGHIIYNELMEYGLEREMVLTAVARRPIDQLVSFYNFIRQRPHHPLYTTEPLEKILRDGSPFAKAAANIQCHYFSPERSFASVEDVISKHKVLLAPLEKLDDLIDSVCEIWEVKRPERIRRANVGAPGYQDEHITPYVRQFVSDKCAEDQRFYDFVSGHGVFTTLNNPAYDG